MKRYNKEITINLRGWNRKLNNSAIMTNTTVTNKTNITNNTETNLTYTDNDTKDTSEDIEDIITDDDDNSLQDKMQDLKETLTERAKKAKDQFYELTKSLPKHWTTDQWIFLGGVVAVVLSLMGCCLCVCRSCKSD